MKLTVGENEAGVVEVTNTLVPIHCLGVPGMGKSHELASLAEQYAAAGCGVLVPDIKDGDLARQIAGRTRQPEKLRLVAPGRVPWTINPLEGDPTIVVSNVLDMFARVGSLQTTFTQLREHLSMALRLATRQPEPGTLHLVERILTDPAVRRRALAAAKLPPEHRVARFWAGFEGGKTDKQRADAVSSTVVVLDQWLVDEPLATILAAPRSSFRLAELLDAGCLVACDLVDGVPPWQTKQLGNLVMARLINAALARPKRPDNRPWVVIADEFDQLAGEFFTYSLDKLRAAGVVPVMAHQNLAQVPRSLEASLSGAPVKLYFRIAGTDLDTLTKRLNSRAEAVALSKLPKRTLRLYEADAEEDDGGRLWWLPEPEKDELGIEAATLDWWQAFDEQQLQQAYDAGAQLATSWDNEEYDHADIPPDRQPERQETNPPDAPGADAPRPDATQAALAALGADRPGRGDPGGARHLPDDDQRTGGRAAVPADGGARRDCAIRAAVPQGGQPQPAGPARPEADRADAGLPAAPAHEERLSGGGEHSDRSWAGRLAESLRPRGRRRSLPLAGWDQTVRLSDDQP